MIVTAFQKSDLWYGKAIMPIIAAVENAELTISRSGCRYLVEINRNGHVIQIIPKKGTPQPRIKTKAPTWGFNFTSRERDFLARMVNSDQTVFLCLVCGEKALYVLKGNAAIDAMTPGMVKPQMALSVQLKNGMYYMMSPNTRRIPIRPSSRSAFMTRLFQQSNNNSL